MKWLSRFLVIFFTMHMHILSASETVANLNETSGATVSLKTFNFVAQAVVTPETPAEVKKTVELPPGGFFVALQIYFPEIPDLKGKQVPNENTAEPARDMKPSEWLATQNPGTVQFKPSGGPTYFYFSKEWKSPLNDKAKLVKGLKLAAPASMTITTKKDGKVTKVDGAILYQVDGVFDTQEAMLQSYPESKVPGDAPDKQANILVVKADGTWEALEDTELGNFAQSGGPFEEGWSNERQQQDIAFEQGVLKALGCFVATTVFESTDAPQLVSLRAFRDKILLTSTEGTRLVSYYYLYGPQWAKDLRHHPVLKAVLKPILSVAAFGLAQMNLESPNTQKIFHVMVSWFEWAASPFMVNDGSHVYDPTRR